MKPLAIALLATLNVIAAPVDDFVKAAAATHGAFGERAAMFLVAHMPEPDRQTLTAEFLTENLDLAMQARTTFPWAKEVPEELFCNDVLPYAVFDEPRDPWRAQFVEIAGAIVKDAKTASEAAQMLNRDLFKRINTHYHTGRKRTNQSPKESMEQGKATCTGLSIILVAACRSVGIPARAAGTPMWHDDSGNHTWVEIWDKGWHFTGADEFNEKGLNHAWFVDKAGRARKGDPRYAIYATSWKKDGGHFPLVWAPQSKDVGGVNVTEHYVTKTGPIPTTIGIRFFEGDERVVKAGELTTVHGMVLDKYETKAGTADMNDMPRLVVEPGRAYRLRFVMDGVPHETQPITVEEAGRNIHDIRAADLAPAPDFSDENAPLTKELAARAIGLTYETMMREQGEARKAELEARSITHGEHTMRWLEKSFGEAPHGKRSLWISMHGGGGAPARVNDQQWQNQIRLYQPEEGIYVAPRAPTDTWNLWHQDHIDPLFDRLIENMVAFRGVDPDKIYLMGYSAGGDGVWQLAPRMADRFAAAAMMAGHPNEASLLGLRNLPFAIFMGANDAAFERNTVAANKSAELAALHKADPDGYTHFSRIYPGLGHWMDRKDAEALPWMAKYQRNPWPTKIVWFQDDVVHQRFYWLRLPDGSAAKEQRITAVIEGRTIRLDGDVPSGTRILLSDELLDLDAPVEIRINDGAPFEATPVRTLATIRTELTMRADPSATPTAAIICP